MPLKIGFIKKALVSALKNLKAIMPAPAVDVYTSIYLKTDIDQSLNYFKSDYKKQVEKIAPKVLENLVPNTQERCNTLYDEFDVEIKNSEQELADSEKKFKDAEKQIIDAEKQVQELENIWLGVKEQYQINNILNPGSVSTISMDYINQMLSTIQTNKTEVEKKRPEFEENKPDYEQEIADNKQKLADAKYQLENFVVDIYQNNLTQNESFTSLKNDLVI